MNIEKLKVLIAKLKALDVCFACSTEGDEHNCTVNEVQVIVEEVEELYADDVTKWNPWISEDDVPLDTYLLMKVEGSYPYQIGHFKKTNHDQIFGTVGNYFAFDCNIIAWSYLQIPN
jgi:hypothetical protein